jgi:hypothetical protein
MKTSHRVLLIAVAVAFVAIPYMFWRGSWFGSPLSDVELDERLHDSDRPRRIQHALSQIADRISRGDTSVRRWYPQVESLGRHPLSTIRITAAWVMGQDNTCAEFHHTLREMLKDSDPMVRRNAALSLVRFQDRSGRDEITGMLLPYTVRAGGAARVSHRLSVGQKVGANSLLARLETEPGHQTEVRSPFSGRIVRVVAADGAMVAPGEALVAIGPESGQVWEALRGLYLIGEPEDLPAVDNIGHGVPDMSDQVRQQALATAQAIRVRSERKSTH